MRGWKPLSPPFLRAVIDQVRSRVLDTALAFERLDPQLGTARGEPVDPQKGATIVTNHIYGGNVNLAQASSDFSQTINATAAVRGDEAALLRELDSLGVNSEAQEDLTRALAADREAADGVDVTEPGPAVSGWLTKMLIGGAEMVKATTTSVAGGSIVALIKAHYGL